MKIKTQILLAIAWLVCGVVCAETTAEDPTQKSYAPYPAPDEGYVTDIANLLTEAQEKQIEDWLYACEKENGFEMAVVTIGSIKDYRGTDNGNVEAFATGLFNQYGIGNMPKNDGVLLLVSVKDREARIELGDGYASDRDKDAERIMQTVIVPEFRNGRFDRGILNGTQSILLKFAGKDVRPARQAPSAQSTTPVQPVQTTQNAAPRQSTQPSQHVPSVPMVLPNRPAGGHGQIPWFFMLLILVVPVLMLLGVLRMVFNQRRRDMSGNFGIRDADEEDDSSFVDDGYNRGFWNGLFLGGSGSRSGHHGLYDQGISFGGRSSHNHGIGFGGHSGGSHHSGFGGGRSAGGFGRGFGGGHSGGSHHSGFGGGFSRGGGATGKW